MRLVTLVNRTGQNLRGVWDGKHYDIEPGAHQFTELQAEAFKRQNVVMGSENPMTGDMEYKLGIVENGDVTTPLATAQGAPAIERWDRSKLAGARPSEVVAGDNGLYSMGRQAGSQPLPADAGFVRP